MLSKKLEAAINGQITWEIYSSLIYLSMSAWCARNGLPGFANWMRVQYEEETFHATRMFDYVCEAGGTVSIGAIDAPQTEWKSPLAVFEHALEHELGVTSRINDLMELAQKEKNHATQIFLHWFVTEQVEEEANVNDIVGKLKLIKDGGAIFMLDRDLATRVFTPPTIP